MRLTTCLYALVSAIVIAGIATVPANAAPDPCSLLSQAQVSAAVGAPVGAGVDPNPTVKRTCKWTATVFDAKGIDFVVLSLHNADFFQTGKMGPVLVTPVGGIGDDAYYSVLAGDVGLVVKKGDVAFLVAVTAHLPAETREAMEKTLAQQAVSKL